MKEKPKFELIEPERKTVRLSKENREDILYFNGLGLKTSEIFALFKAEIKVFLIRSGVKNRKKHVDYTRPRLRDDIDRIVSLYKSGKTLEEIGNQYGVTRERIRQILREYGISKEDGGGILKAKKSRREREIKKQRKRDQSSMKCYGVTRTRLDEIKTTYGSEVILRYKEQRNNAISQRAIDWILTIDEWIDIWEESGKFNERGRGSDCYVLTRKGAEGPFSKDNCYITTLAKSSSNGIKKAIYGGAEEEAI